MDEKQLSELINRLQAYSADTMLCSDYAAAMIKASDALIGLRGYKAAYEALSALHDMNKADARRFVFMAKGIFGGEAELEKLAEASKRAFPGSQVEPTNIEELRVVLDAIQEQYNG